MVDLMVGEEWGGGVAEGSDSEAVVAVIVDGSLLPT